MPNSPSPRTLQLRAQSQQHFFGQGEHRSSMDAIKLWPDGLLSRASAGRSLSRSDCIGQPWTRWRRELGE